MTACSMIGLTDDQVITSIDNVVPGSEVVAVNPSELPSGVITIGDTMVLVDREDVIDPTDVIEPDSRGGGASDIVSGIFGVGKAFFPWLAAWEGVLALMFKRKRLHYGNAFKRVIPGNSFSLPGAFNSLVAGLGMKHTDPADSALPKASANPSV